jgi:hypothetical protein
MSPGGGLRPHEGVIVGRSNLRSPTALLTQGCETLGRRRAVEDATHGH